MTEEKNNLTAKSLPLGLRQAARHLLIKTVLVAITILVGVFFTIVIANRSGQMEISVNKQIDRYLRSEEFRSSLAGVPEEEYPARREAARLELLDESGLNLPFWQRHLRWTWNALRFDWGRLVLSDSYPVYGQARRNTAEVRDILLSYFPNTLLLAASANLLIFIFGIPLSLYLARNYGGKVDRLISFMSPLSSVPSWAIGVLLVSIFAVELGWLPTSGMFDKLPPETALGYIPVVARRMILPVSAIFISLFFQLVTTWRTFFVLYAQEDYVELGKAQGLSHRRLEKLYILKPALPYVITSFSMILVGFWQTTMALEVIFKWPGIGWLYVERALPNFWGESMYPGEILLAIGIVVMFAYLLGGVVLILDLAYVIVDPRIKMEAEPVAELSRPRRPGWWKFWKNRAPERFPESTHRKPAAVIDVATTLEAIQIGLKDTLQIIHKVQKEIRQYPSAILGLFLLSILVLGSVYAVIALPYETIGREWRSGSFTGQPEAPQLAQPAWINWFRTEKYLSALRITKPIEQTITQGETTTEISQTYTFDFSYADFPNEIYLYLKPTFNEKHPYASIHWITPDGRNIKLKGTNLTTSQVRYDFSDGLSVRRLVAQNPDWQSWFNFGNVLPTPIHYALFAQPQGQSASVQKGTYTLQIETIFFDTPAPEMQTELILLGQVYGAAGTDYYRRDLLVPMLWGMPFALAFGLFGATATTLLSMLLAAGSAWYGGWIDSILQRLTEANMVLPILAIGVLAYALFGLNIWVVLAMIIALNIFGSPSKTFRSAFLQVKQAPYIEAARAYGASNHRIILQYMIPRIIPIIIPQLIALVPTFVFLEATLGIFNIKSDYPTWGTVIYQGLTRGALYGPKFWVLQPIALLLMTSLAFALLGSALEKILNPRLQD